MGIDYRDQFQHAADKLLGSYVWVKGEPAYIRDIDIISGSLSYFKLKHLTVGRETAFSADLKDVNTSPFKLGYVNYTNYDKSIFTYRTPSRYYKQGLRRDTVKCLKGFRPDFNNVGFYNTVMGIYPTLEQSLKSLKDGPVYKIGLSRHFCLDTVSLSDPYKLLYKDKDVGEFSDKKGFVLNEDFSFLERLMQCQIKM